MIEARVTIGFIPRKNDLVFYAKLDSENGFNYFSRYLVTADFNNTQLVATIGPYLEPNSSATIGSSSSTMANFSLPSLDLSSFTLSFHLWVNGDENVEIFKDTGTTLVNLELFLFLFLNLFLFNSPQQ